MPKKIRIDATSLGQLRDMLSGVDVDLGCRPVATKKDDRYSVIAIAEDADIGRLEARIAPDARAAGDIRIEVLEELPPPEVHLRMVQQQNRYLRGEIPRGLGRKE